MSVAERKAQEVYERFHIETLEEDVQRQLIIIMLNNGLKQTKPGVSHKPIEYPEPYTVEELRSRVAEAEKDIIAGRTLDPEDVEAELEQKYPWLCK